MTVAIGPLYQIRVEGKILCTTDNLAEANCRFDTELKNVGNRHVSITLCQVLRTKQRFMKQEWATQELIDRFGLAG